MEELENFFYKLLSENKKEMINVLKHSLLKEVCEACYDRLARIAMEGKEMTAEELYVDILTTLEKDAS